MRHNWPGLLLFFIPLLFAAQKNDSITKYNLTISTFNDSWGGGFTHINDDYRSYGANVTFEAPQKFRLLCRVSGLTDKGRENFADRARLDELLIAGQFILKKDVFKYLDIYGTLGIYDINRYGGENLQNLTHAVFGISPVVLNYSDFRRTFFVTGTNFISHPPALRSFESVSLCLQPEMEAFISPGYFASIRPKLPLKLISPKGDYFSLSLGYQYSEPISGNPLLRITITRVETGPTLEYKMHVGIFFIDWKMYLQSNFSTGSYGFNIMLARKKGKYAHHDLGVEAGTTADADGYYSKYLWNKSKRIKDQLQFVFYHQYGTYLKRKLIDYPKLYGHYMQLSFGVEGTLMSPVTKFPLIPYAGVHLGLKRELIYSGTEKTSEQQAFSPFAFGEIGIKIKPPGHLFYENTRWGFSVHYKYLYSFLRTNDATFSQLCKSPASMGYFGAGIFVNLDL